MTQDDANLILYNVIELIEETNERANPNWSNKFNELGGAGDDVITLIDLFLDEYGDVAVAEALESARSTSILATVMLYYETRSEELIDEQKRMVDELYHIILDGLETLSEEPEEVAAPLPAPEESEELPEAPEEPEETAPAPEEMPEEATAERTEKTGRRKERRKHPAQSKPKKKRR